MRAASRAPLNKSFRQHMPSQTDDWSLKEYRPEGSPQRWFFRKNLAPEIAVRHPDYPYLVYLTFVYVPRDESGLPTTADEHVENP